MATDTVDLQNRSSDIPSGDNAPVLLTAAADGLFEQLNWPSPEDEAWRRTPLKRLLPKGALDTAASAPRRSLEGAEERPRPMLPDNYAARVVTEGGIPVAMALSDQAVDAGLTVEWAETDELPAAVTAAGRAELDTAADRITAWHWRDMPGALVLHLPRQAALDGPVVVEERLLPPSSVQDCDTPVTVVSVPHLHVDAGESSSIEVVWSFEGVPCNPGTPIVNSGLSILAAANARVNFTLRQQLGSRTAVFMHDRIELERDARVEFLESHLGGSVVKTRARVILGDEGSDARLKGIYVGGEGRHVDLGTIQEHRSPRANSDALYKGAVHPGGRTVFSGLIEVSPKAAGTDAYLTNKNLVLGDGARADSIPQLNILTDDVRCSHGSTTGKLDPSELFYLQARGFSPVEASRELTRAFMAEVIDRVPEAVRDFLSADLDAALAWS